MSTIRVASVVGARPQFIKAAPVQQAFSQSKVFASDIYHTGQHHDDNMSDVFFRELGITAPHRHLGLSGGGHGQMTGRMLEALEAAFLEDKPDVVLVYGDTNSTLAGALAAAKLHLPIVHIEAGLRSFNRRMPEEINRVLTDHVSSLLFCPTRSAVENLRNEGIVKGVYFVGDVMFDATLAASRRAKDESAILDTLSLEEGGFVLCTLHRAENTGSAQALTKALDFVRDAANGLPVVLPLHPRTKKVCADLHVSLDGFTVIEPVGYLDMQRLLGACALVCTDSGGLQKEAYFQSRPCITLRDETEWVETVDAGWNRLWTSSQWRAPRQAIPDYGTGDAATAIITQMEKELAR